jgi:putative nucleotidyltransferase with HDIG domain
MASMGSTPARRAADASTLLREARESERMGRMADAIRQYEDSVDASVECGDEGLRAEANRRLGVVLLHRNDIPRARALVLESLQIAQRIDHNTLAAEALNALAGIEFETGAIEASREAYRRALALAGERPDLLGRIQQNLGILATIKGDWSNARTQYLRALDSFRLAGESTGCAIAYHNLGMLSVDQKLWDDADSYFSQSLALADELGDVHLQGLCRLNHSEVHLARRHYDRARECAEAALQVFDGLGSMLDKADAYRVLGVVFRETGRPVLAEARLRSAIELAVTTGSVLSEAEASREMARLYRDMGRNQDALTLLNTAHRLFGRLDATVHLVDVARKRSDLEDTYLAVVRDWGQSIESSDRYTFGHCERVAEYAIAVARALGLDDLSQTTIRLGAYLHDLGKVRVPHEILNKPGRLTREEFEVMKMHPVWGLELLAAVEFPWDIKPMIRWHHERFDGTGYPDRLKGDEIPLSAQIIGIADVYDALTTLRSYRPAMSREVAIARMQECRPWWRSDVFGAFLRTVEGAA